MKRVKLFPKIFLYTFLVMMFVTVLAHVLLYIFAPQMTLALQWKGWRLSPLCNCLLAIFQLKKNFVNPQKL